MSNKKRPLPVTFLVLWTAVVLGVIPILKFGFTLFTILSHVGIRSLNTSELQTLIVLLILGLLLGFGTLFAAIGVWRLNNKARLFLIGLVLLNYTTELIPKIYNVLFEYMTPLDHANSSQNIIIDLLFLAIYVVYFTHKSTIKYFQPSSKVADDCIILTTAMGLDDCKNSIQALAQQGYVVKVDQDNFKLWKNMPRNDSFISVFFGNLKEIENGTMIKGRVDLDSQVELRMYLCMLLEVLFGGLAIFSEIKGNGISSFVILPILILTIMLTATGAMLHFGKKRLTKQRPNLIRLMEQQLDAQVQMKTHDQDEVDVIGYMNL